MAGTALWGAYAACQFALYDAVQQRVPAEHRHRPLATLAMGCVAAVGATTATFPLDLLRTTMAAQGSPPIHAGMAALVRHTWQQAGPRGFYLVRPRACAPGSAASAALTRVEAPLSRAQGLVPSLVQVVPYMGLSFSFYETARGWCAAAAPGADSTVCSAAAGTLAGCAAKLLVYPLDTAKRRIQVFLLARSAPGHFAALASGPPHRPPSTAAVLSRMLEHEGVAAAYRGAAVAMLRAGVAAGAHFAVYERLRAALQ